MGEDGKKSVGEGDGRWGCGVRADVENQEGRKQGEEGMGGRGEEGLHTETNEDLTA